MPRHVVAQVGEIPEGGRKLVEVDGIPVGVFHAGGEYYAVLNRCPHQAAPLCEGRLWSGLVTSDLPGEYVIRRDVPVISCIWHGWEFDLRTGQSVCDPARLRVRAYDVRVEPTSSRPALEPGAMHAGGGTQSATAGSGPGAGASHLAATTFPVDVSDGWVVVDLDRRPAREAIAARVGGGADVPKPGDANDPRVP